LYLETRAARQAAMIARARVAASADNALTACDSKAEGREASY
jgi:hypothetical protein